MPFAAGTYTLPVSSVSPAVVDTVISPTDFNALSADYAAALNKLLLKDGTGSPSANIPFGGFKLTGMAAGVADTDSASIIDTYEAVTTYGNADSPVTLAKVNAVVFVTCAAGNVSITLPAANAWTAGKTREIIVIRTDSTANTLTIAAAGADNIDAVASIVVPALCKGAIVSNGISAWRSRSLTTTNFIAANLLPAADAATARTALGLATIASSGSGADLTANTVTLGKIATQADQTFLGNVSGGVAQPSALTVAQVLTAIGYEVGTFTPTATYATVGDLSVAYTIQAGTYFKMGKQLNVFFRIAFTPTFTTASGNFTIAGLPYASKATDTPIGAIDVPTAFTWPASRTQLVSRMAGSATTLNISAQGTGVGSTFLTASNITSGVACEIRGSFSYQTP